MQPAPLKRRAAALVYESLTAGSVTAAAAVPAGIAVTAAKYGAPALLPAAPAFASAVFLWAWWLYFSLNWLREGQTLPMRVWNIGLANVSGCRPAKKRLFVRFAWACVLLVFIPMLSYAGLQSMGWHGRVAAGAALCWWLLPWGFALFHPRRQFLYDVLAGTELVDLRRRT